MTDGTRARLGDAILLRLRDALADRYELLDELGRGGMATVYVARDLKHDREVALKVMDPSLARGVGAARFLREVRIAATLTHPGIVPVFDSGEVDDTFYYVMPLLRGASLRSRMLKGPIAPRDACLMLAEVADALDAAHRANVVHRDVKPENILLADGRPLVTDFGVAHAARTWFGESLTDTGTAVGTLLYMAPEQLFGAADVDGRADVFSVGAMLYEMLSGKPPFAAPTMPAAMARLASEPTPALPDSVRVSPALREALARATSRERDERFGTAHELAEALRTAAMDEGTEGTMRRPAPRSTRWRPRRRTVMATAIAVVAIAATGVALARPRRAASDDASAHPSLAVLSFANASQDPKLAYFSDGVAQELQSALADVAGLRVASRTSADSWRGRSADPREIARGLGVSDLLEGGVARTADSVRIYVRLVDGRTGEQRWTRKYDRKLADVFDVQEEVARAVVRELRVALGSGGDTTLVRARTQSVDAHDLALRASFESRSVLPAALERAVALADSSIALDSAYAPAWATKARVLNSMAIFRDRKSPDLLHEARVAAERAVTIDSLSADAQTALGALLFRYDWRWADAERHLRRAIALNPAFVQAHAQFARVLRSLGRFNEARAELTEAHRLDGARPGHGMELGRVSFYARDYERAIRETQTSSRDTGVRDYRYWLGEDYLGARRFAEAEPLLAPDSSGPSQLLALLRVATGHPAQARTMATAAERAESWHLEELAEVYAALGERDRALTLLERAVAQHDVLVVDFLVRPGLDPLRAEPRFQALMRQLAFPAAAKFER